MAFSTTLDTKDRLETGLFRSWTVLGTVLDRSTRSYFDYNGIYNYLQVDSQLFSEPINFGDLSRAYLSNTF